MLYMMKKAAIVLGLPVMKLFDREGIELRNGPTSCPNVDNLNTASGWDLHQQIIQHVKWYWQMNSFMFIDCTAVSTVTVRALLHREHQLMLSSISQALVYHLRLADFVQLSMPCITNRFGFEHYSEKPRQYLLSRRMPFAIAVTTQWQLMRGFYVYPNIPQNGTAWISRCRSAQALAIHNM